MSKINQVREIIEANVNSDNQGVKQLCESLLDILAHKKNNQRSEEVVEREAIVENILRDAEGPLSSSEVAERFTEGGATNTVVYRAVGLALKNLRLQGKATMTGKTRSARWTFGA